MKKTLIQMTQDILSALDGDEVNSITDTVESEQVARIIRDTFYFLSTELNLPEQEGPFELTASGDNTKPVLMTVPSNVRDLYWIKYDTIDSGDSDKEYTNMSFLPLEEFIQRSHALDTTDSDTAEMNYTTSDGTFEFKYKTDTDPTTWTAISDNTIIFDSHDATVDTTLQKSKTFCYGMLMPTFSLSDNHTPALDANQFQLLQNESTAACYTQLRQMRDTTSERRARRGWIGAQTNKTNVPHKTSGLAKVKRYGRRK